MTVCCKLCDFIEKTNTLEYEEIIIVHIGDLLIILDAVLKLYCYTKIHPNIVTRALCFE